MEKLVKGDIVVFQFPFSDLDESKKRPALIVANTIDENLILCQITSQERNDSDAISLIQKDFQQGSLNHESFIRPTVIFTVHKSKIEYKAGKLKQEKIKIIEKKYYEIFTR
ncbi:MAG: type II toxin-antitoxin system PemK/MazF family toxin [Candidatus Nanoarchaeia archaeon]|nr:type II toxin-antitoxin system PemK/MazF family toxin [Candidatus Nanoarchaeia archaeon]